MEAKSVFFIGLIWIFSACILVESKPPSPMCWEGMAECSKKHITHGKCGNVLHRVQLFAIRFDMNRDCMREPQEMRYYFSMHMGVGENEYVCLDDVIKFETEYFGCSENLVRWVWGMKFGQECVSVEEMIPKEKQPIMGMIDEHLAGTFVKYCMQPPNLRDDAITCSAIVNLCKYHYPHIDVCKHFLSQHNPPFEFRSTVWDKAEHHTYDVDKNMDGNTTRDEVVLYNLSIDRDGNQCTDLNENVDYWMSTYNFTRSFAEFTFYSARDVNANGCLETPEFDWLPPVFPNYMVTRSQIERLAMMCASDPTESLFSTNIDCGEIPMVCKYHYQDSEACMAYSDCGMDVYAHCVNGLKSTSCYDEHDRKAVDMEIHGVNNFLAHSCFPMDPVDVRNESVLVEPFFLSTLFVCITHIVSMIW